ncbi:hypothetical protein MY11210_004299 [Beauveria gryllotalpidicola]
MKLSVALAAAFLAATTTALPAVEEDAAANNAPALQDWGMPIINHIPVPDTRRSSPGLDKVSDNDGDTDKDLDDFGSAVQRRAGRAGAAGGRGRPRPVVITMSHPKNVPDDGRGVDKDDFENFDSELQRRAPRHRPIVDHTPIDRRADAETSSGKPVSDTFWGMPIVDHVPVPDADQDAVAADKRAELESRKEPFPIVDHKPAEP